jgi:hypothetical protein
VIDILTATLPPSAVSRCDGETYSDAPPVTMAAIGEAAQ